MKISELLKQAADELESSGSSTPRLDAMVLLEYAAKKDRGWLLARQNEEADTSFQGRTLERYRGTLQRRASGEPLAYIAGVKEFYGLELEVSPAILIPRPESEALVGMAIELAPEKSRLIDVGTGSGAIAIAIAKQRPDLTVTASDVSSSALQVAEKNAKKHGLVLNFINTSLLNEIEDSYETVVANLPYVPAGFKAQAQKELSFEPEEALYSGNDGLDLYRKLIDQLDGYPLSKLLIIEADPRQHEELSQLAAEHGWQFEWRQDFGLAFSKRQSN